MLKRSMVLLLALAGCGDSPAEPLTPSVSARAINLSGLAGEISIWMDGVLLSGNLVHSQPSQPLSIAAGSHTFGYSAAGAAGPDVTSELTIPEEGFTIVALIKGRSGPELRLVTYPPLRQGMITIRALNVSDESARVRVFIQTGAPGGPVEVTDVAPGTFTSIEIAGTTTITTVLGQTVSPTTFSMRTGRPADPLSAYTVIYFHDLGFPVSGEVRTLVFHRSTEDLPDVYSF